MLSRALFRLNAWASKRWRGKLRSKNHELKGFKQESSPLVLNMGFPGLPTCFAVGVIMLGGYEIYRYFDWEQKKVWIQERMMMTPVELPMDMTEDTLKQMEYRPFYVKGKYLHEREMRKYPVYIDKALGLHLYTPFERSDDGSLLIINRGWIPSQLRNKDDRKELNFEDELTVYGYLYGGDTPLQWHITENISLGAKHAPERDDWRWVDRLAMAEWSFTKPILLFAFDSKRIGGYPVDDQIYHSLSRFHGLYGLVWTAVGFGMLFNSLRKGRTTKKILDKAIPHKSIFKE